MPGAGDALNVKPNLQTLASLSSRSKGVKLSFNTETGLFSVQGVGLKQKVVRSFTKESVLDETRFREPLLELFRAAAERLGDDVEDLFYEARRGLRWLGTTYERDEEKASVVARVIEELDRWIEFEGGGA